MFDGLYPEAAGAALTAKINRGPEPAPPVPWFRNFWSAAGQAIPRAGAEMGRAMTSLQTPAAVGAMDAPTMFSAPGRTPKPQLEQELRQQDSAIRDAIREMTPDPQSTGAASMLLHEVTRFVGKAAGYSALGGTPAAVIGMGLDEGINEAKRRMDEGVDDATAAKLGITKGLASAAAVALPVAGKTIPQTVGLAAAGGPGSFIAEQAVARKILQDADYLNEAAQVDPFDPMGLGVSFLGSLIFGAGAHAMRGARGAMVTPEQVDAAHVALLQADREALALTARPEVMGEHDAAMDLAAQQLAAGERVQVDAPADPVRVREQMEAALQRMRDDPLEGDGQPAPARPFPDVPTEIGAIEATMPDLLVMLEGMDAPMSARELLEQVRAMKEQETADAPLFKVAAECLLRG